jgi:hypothetical protein
MVHLIKSKIQWLMKSKEEGWYQWMIKREIY